jgi:HAMP domain-containing protein
VRDLSLGQHNTEAYAAFTRTLNPMAEDIGDRIATLASRNSKQAQADVARAVAHSHLLNRIALAVAAASLALAIGVGLVLHSRVTRALATLVAAMEDMAGGNLDRDVPGRDAPDEIGAVARALDAIKDMVAARAAKAGERRVAVQQQVVGSLGKGLAAMRDGRIPPEQSSLEADTLRLTVDPTKLTPGVYSARLRLHTWQGANTPELEFKLRVDSPQTILTPLTVLPAPVEFQPRVQIIEAPSPRAVAPPAVDRPAPPSFPKHKPRPKPQPSAKHTHAIGRSRVLPFPKVTIPAPKPKQEKPASPTKEPAKDAKQEKPAPKQTAKAEPPKPAPAKKEAPPERTKPSAMPPAPAKH